MTVFVYVNTSKQVEIPSTSRGLPMWTPQKGGLRKTILKA
ncbi:hypothetical protein V1290_000444 [Bradyrhizobium sp. AZCC 1578]